MRPTENKRKKLFHDKIVDKATDKDNMRGIKLQTKRLIFILISLLMVGQVHSDSTSYLGGSSGDSSATTDNRNLTDHERWMTENYQHEGYMRRAYEEECLDQGDARRRACQGMDESNSTLMIISKLYGTVLSGSQMMGLSLGTFTRGSTDSQGKPLDSDGVPLDASEDKYVEHDGKLYVADENGARTDEAAQQGEDEVTDYCAYVAGATEMVAMTMQQMNQEDISSTPMQEGNEHRQSLYRASQAHSKRADNAKIQVYGWGATTACYVYLNATTQADWQGPLKLAAAGILTGFWIEEMKNHSDLADKMKEIADGLPGAGDCNPIDDRDCYCAQPETRYDPKYCLPPGFKNIQTLADASVQVTCTNDKLENDPECRCRRTNSCYDEVMRHKFEGMHFGEGFNSAAMEPFNNIMRGELTSGRVSAGSFGQDQRAIADRALRQVQDHLDGFDAPRNLTAEQREKARELQELGIPGKLAAKMATSPLDNEEASKNFANSLSRPSGQSFGSSSHHGGGDRSRILSFGGGRGLDGNNRRRARDSGPDNPFKDFMNQGQENQDYDNDRVLMFRGRAAASQGAQISNNQNHSVFDIISHRYRRSAWKRLELEP